MVDLMVLFLELVATIIVLVTKPFSLVKLSCLFGLRSFFLVVHTWVELVRAAICLHVYILWKFLIWTVAILSLPVRVLTSLQRERLLEMHLHEIQIELENLVCDRKELEERLQMAIKEHRMMEIMLAELEEEHDQAIIKIELLEGELQDVKDENLRLKEVHGKGLWSFRDQDDTGNDHNTNVADKYDISYGVPSWRSIYDRSGIILQDLLVHSDAWENERKSKTDLPDFVRTGSEASEPIHSLRHGTISRKLDLNEVLDHRREVALSQSLFSAVLSLLVGMIIWEAEDPCMPLVVALFTVVGISLKSVVQFFYTIKNKPASDAVALLSFNWFILGTLTYPTLPRVAHVLTPLALRFLERTVCWLGFSF
ncbi:uncharacterized protein LOC132310502 [Cornus florida]|uniref:uncharacterized protein LOC132310502 n=1 Tax=Cornus florida TaxID=4283 RepID=UPI00289D4B5A|nr:uncharacterized protein LOC132310502 [Cornus florida]